MRFGTWCKKDVNDERKINYTLKTYEGEILEFTSDDDQPLSMLSRLHDSWVEKIVLVDNEWFATLYESK